MKRPSRWGTTHTERVWLASHALAGFFNAHYQYHLQGVGRKPLPEGGLTEFMHKNAFLCHLSCITICYERAFFPSFSDN
ncbi:hypothetical protein DXF93_11925 [Escherichia coli]|nr:hypothetical protein DXF93_11925 [Escherichia coli]